MTGAAFIKCREIGRKQWASGVNRLRIHAIRFATVEKAQALIDENAADNPEWEWLIVPA
jgi:hypothetical protein